MGKAGQYLGGGGGRGKTDDLMLKDVVLLSFRVYALCGFSIKWSNALFISVPVLCARCTALRCCFNVIYAAADLIPSLSFTQRGLRS